LKGNPATTLVTATFTKLIDAASLTAATFYLSGAAGTVPATFVYDSTSHLPTLTPSSPLGLLTTYTVHVTSGVMDQTGVHPAAPATWHFVTGSDPAFPSSINGLH